MKKTPIQWISMIALLTFAGLFMWRTVSTGVDLYLTVLFGVIALFWLVGFVRKHDSGSQGSEEE